MDSLAPRMTTEQKKFDFKPCRWTLIYNTTRSSFIIMMLVGKIMELMQNATAVMD
jgi:hypothetical protein